MTSSFMVLQSEKIYPGPEWGGGGALTYETDIGVGQRFSHPGASGERKIK